MRRENAKFNAAYISSAGDKLFNNDYYGAAELKSFACYVIADGLEPGERESAGARTAVQAAIAAFHEHPSISKSQLKRYMQAAHKALRQNAGRESMRASITIVVTDYQKVRYAWAGNTRFYLYRAGRVINESKDHSLARQMSDRGELALDKIARHEERNNLSCYAGQPGSLNPEIAKPIKLQDGDIFLLLSRGIWEWCDQGDIRSVLDSSEGDPNLALDELDRLLLDPAPDVDNFTAGVVFVDKVYVDPNKGKKLKRILMIAIPVAILLLVLVIVLVVLHNKKVAARQEMNTDFVNAVEYVGDNNYPKASTALDAAIALANKIKDQGAQTKIGNWQKMVDAVANADQLFAAGDYAGAQAAYLTALDRSRFTDNAGQSYLQGKLALVGNRLRVQDLLALGDTLQAKGDYPGAESKYNEAAQLAAATNDDAGRTQAIAAQQNLYSAQDRADAQQKAANDQQAKALQDSADAEAAGDNAMQNNDLVQAKINYQIALDRFNALSDSASAARINTKLQQLAGAQAQNDAQSQAAAQYVSDGDKLYDAGNYVDAKVQYILARNIYSQLQDSVALANVLARIDQCDSKINGAAASSNALPAAGATGPGDTQTPASASKSSASAPAPASLAPAQTGAGAATGTATATGTGAATGGQTQ